MRTERFKGALLSTLLIASLMSPLLLISAKAAWGQEIEWIKQFGTSDDDSALGVAVDASGWVYKVEPEPAKGFYWAYYLYLPSSITDRANGNVYLLVETNNTGFPSDNQSIHDEAARQLIEWRSSMYAKDLKVPLLVPTFPRLIIWGPSPYEIYTHALDRNTLLTEIDNLKRIDLQLIAMIDDVTEKFSLAGITVENKVLMMGYSASGAFVNRFTLLHPERVRAAAIGAPGGWPIAPLGEWNGVKLEYPIGVWDVKELVGKEFNIISVKSIPLYFYMGDKDTNDMWGSGSLVSELFGDTPIKRWPIAENMYKSVRCASQFVLYPGVGHTITQKMVDDVKTFFLEQIANTPPGENVQVTPIPGVSVTFENVATGGGTTVTTSTAGPPPPTSYGIVGIAGQPIYYNITTTAAYSGSIIVCISYDETQVAGPEANLRLMQKVDGWKDFTTSVDTENNIICGTTTTLSIFIVAGPLAPPPPVGRWDALITATFSGGSDDAIFGVRPDATPGFDNAYDIPEPPPPVAPPYVRTFFYYPEQTLDELHRSSLAPENLMEWPLRIEYADDIEDITLMWSVENVPTEYNVLLYRGEDLVADMRAEENYTIEATAGSYDFRIVVGKLLPFTLELTHGWNMISFPVLPENMSPDSIFDGYYVLYGWDAENKRYVLHADSGSFVEPDPNVEVGVGYWVYVLEDENVDLLGVLVNQLNLSLRQGWNLIGPPYGGSSIADLADDPDNSVIPWAFTWNSREKSYSMTQLLEAGKGYWAHALRDCTLTLLP